MCWKNIWNETLTNWTNSEQYTYGRGLEHLLARKHDYIWLIAEVFPWGQKSVSSYRVTGRNVKVLVEDAEKNLSDLNTFWKGNGWANQSGLPQMHAGMQLLLWERSGPVIKICRSSELPKKHCDALVLETDFRKFWCNSLGTWDMVIQRHLYSILIGLHLCTPQSTMIKILLQLAYLGPGTLTRDSKGMKKWQTHRYM